MKSLVFNKVSKLRVSDWWWIKSWSAIVCKSGFLVIGWKWRVLRMAWTCFTNLLLSCAFPYQLHRLFEGGENHRYHRIYFLIWTILCIVQTWKMQSNIWIWHGSCRCVGWSFDGNKVTARFATRGVQSILLLSCQLISPLSFQSIHLLVSCLGHQAKPFPPLPRWPSPTLCSLHFLSVDLSCAQSPFHGIFKVIFISYEFCLRTSLIRFQH